MSRRNPRIDFIFRKLFGVEENKELLIDLINSIVDEKDKVEKIQLINPFDALDFAKDRMSIIKLKAKNLSNNSWVYIELEMLNCVYNFKERVMYNFATTYKEVKELEYPENKLHKIISINFSSINYLPEKDYHNVFQIANRKSKKLLGEDLEIHLLELSKLDSNKDEKNLLEKWMCFLKESGEYEVPSELKEIPGIRKALEYLENMNLTTEENDCYENRLKWLRDTLGAISTARNEGKREGLKEAIERGKSEAKLDVALRLREINIDINTISEITEIPKEKLLEMFKEKKEQ